ncbi:MAG: 5'-nucleotidase C-terminal domain-containing protein [Kofleriaceae bacterium]
MQRTLVALACAALLSSCGAPATNAPPPAPSGAPGAGEPAAALPPQPAPAPVTLSIVGTNDLHGALPRLPILAGYLHNLRDARRADGGGVILLDGGDLFQGTLESNIAEGADVVTAYNALGYTAAAIGNHEFDFGPVGPDVTVQRPGDDPRGALKARAAEAKFPFLVANIIDEQTRAGVAWPNVLPSIKVQVAGVSVGIIGLSTEVTPTTTMPANFLGLRMSPSAEAATYAARKLRAEGAKVVVIAAHVGSKCKDLTNPDDVSSCDRDEEVFRILQALEPGLIDAWVGGHTHAAMAHRVNGVAVIESYASGRAFGRVDLLVSADGIVSSKIYPPTDLCPLGPDKTPVSAEACAPGEYEGKPVVRDPAIQAIVDAASERTRERREEDLGVTALATITRSYDHESALGNWFTDLMLAARPDAQIALTNGGGLRANVPAGPITYGELFQAMPFDNRFALIKLQGRQVREMIAQNLGRGGAQYSWGGLTVTATCKAAGLALDVRVAGKPLVDGKVYTVVTSDFLAAGGDGTLSRFQLPPSSIEVTEVIIRDAFAELLRAKRGAAKRLDVGQLFNPQAPRQRFPGSRPVTCGAAR